MRSHERNDTAYWLDSESDKGFSQAIRPKKAGPAKTTSRVKNQRRETLAEQLYQEEAGFNFTYKASRHEQQWLSGVLRSFYEDSLVSDVLGMVKGGKEANVYCCQAHPNTGKDLAAVKVYRPRLLRNLKNDAIYKEGRAVLSDDGKSLHPLRDHRAMRALNKKTRFGAELSITSWIEYEYQTLRLLYKAGADVPAPIAQNGNAILMEYIGEEGNPAPTLQTVTLRKEEAQPLFERLMMNVELMLSHKRVHADLSAYNVLYWQDRVTIIDFPQVVDPETNPLGFSLLRRDIERVCQYFGRYGLSENPDTWARYFWRKKGFKVQEID
jgi:RIO kinase 1